MGYKMQMTAYKYELNIILVIACHMLQDLIALFFSSLCFIFCLVFFYFSFLIHPIGFICY